MEKLQYRKTPRADWIDYDNGHFFVTVCTAERIHYFGSVENGYVILSELGKFVDYQLANASAYRNDIEILNHVVMPNHIHFIATCGIDPEPGLIESFMPSAQRNLNTMHRNDKDLPRTGSRLGEYVGSLKGVVTKYARMKGESFGWQERYYDRKIRDQREMNLISNYIDDNPIKWEKDEFFG